MIINSINKAFSLLCYLLFLMLAYGCHTNAPIEEPSVREALKLGFDIALKDSILTDWEKTKDSLGRFLVYPPCWSES